MAENRTFSCGLTPQASQIDIDFSVWYKRGMDARGLKRNKPGLFIKPVAKILLFSVSRPDSIYSNSPRKG